MAAPASPGGRSRFDSGRPTRIVALLSWYDEDPALLHGAVSSVAPHVDRLVALDGAYALFPGAQARSDPAQRQAIREAAGVTPVTVRAPGEPWAGGEVQKRARLFQLGRRHVRGPQDWFVILDADEHWTRAPEDLHERLAATGLDVAKASASAKGDPGSTAPIEKFFRALPGLTVKGTHYHYCAEGEVVLWGGRQEAPSLDLSGVVVIEHREREDAARANRARAYYAVRDRARIEVPPPAPLLRRADRTGEPLPKITLTGPDPYRGYDPETGEQISLAPGESAEVSQAKADQLAEDFPGQFKVSAADGGRPRRTAERKPRKG